MTARPKLAGVPPVPAPVLPRLSRTEAQARSALAQRARDLPVTVGGLDWRLDVEPLTQLPAGWLADRGCWTVQGHWAGAPFALWLAPDVANQIAPGRFAGLDLPALPDDLALALLEWTLRDLTEGLSAQRRGPARLDRIARGAAADPALPHAMALRLRGEQVEVDALLMTSGLGLMLMAGLVAARPPVAGPVALDDCPLRLTASIGSSRLPARLAASLQIGDAVLIDHPVLGEDGSFRLAAGRWGLRVRTDGPRLVVVETLNATELTMASTDKREGAAALDDLPLELSFDLGVRSMTLGELRVLQVGQVLELERPLSEGVHIRANGRWLASGELVEIDGRMAVSITALAPGRDPA